MGTRDNVAGASIEPDAASNLMAGNDSNTGRPHRVYHRQWGIHDTRTLNGIPRPCLAIAATPCDGGPEAPTSPQGVHSASSGSFENPISLCTRRL